VQFGTAWRNSRSNIRPGDALVTFLRKTISWIGLLALPLLAYAAPAVSNSETTVTWSWIGESPVSAAQTDNLFLGLHGDVLIVAGSPPKGNGGQEDASPQVWVATRDPGSDLDGDGVISPGERPLAWLDTGKVLPGNHSYGISASHQLGLLAISNSDRAGQVSNVVLMRWAQKTGQLQILQLPELAAVTRNGSAAVLGDMLYVVVANGDVHGLDLSRIETDPAGNPVVDGELVAFSSKIDVQGRPVSPWQQLPSLPQTEGLGESESRMVAVIQNDGRFDRLFVIAMRSKFDYLSGVPASDRAAEAGALPGRMWALDSGAEDSDAAWVPRMDVLVQGVPVSLSDASGVAVGQTYFLLFGNSSVTGKRTVLAYNAVTNVWTEYDDLSAQSDDSGGSATMTRGVKWGKEFVLISASPDAANAAGVWAVRLKSPEAHIGWRDMTVVLIYLLAMVLVGFYFTNQNKDTNDFFRGGQHIPWWAAACSIYATLLSSLTYLALPALVYRTDWVLYGGFMTTPFILLLIAYVIMPAYRKLGITSVYEYLSARYNMAVRLFASALYVLFQIGRMGIILALTALALAAITPLDAWESVLIMGLLALVYSTMGGVAAVIWTDTIQTVVLMIGVIICLALVFASLDGGISEYIRVGVSDNKFKIVNLDFGSGSIHTLAIWVIILGSFGQNTSNYTADQAIVQRYMTAKDIKSAVKTVWMTAAITAPSLFLFYLLGTALYVFYQAHPARLDPALHTDQLIPLFISAELPVGLAGLMVAGIFAATQSSISTSMNSSASIVVTDFMRPVNFCSTEQGYLNAARWITVIVGILGTAAGTIFINPEIRSLLVEYFKVIGMFMGVLGGLFLLGLLTKRTNSWGAMIGIFSGVAVVLVVWQLDLAHGFIYATIGIVSCMLIGYVASLLTPWANHDIEGLTVYTMRKTE
jgi:SSS family transporter